MDFISQLKRLFKFYRENGFVNTVKRIFTILIRTFIKNKTFVFYINLDELNDLQKKESQNILVECKKNMSEIQEKDIVELVEKRGQYRGREVILNQITLRFNDGANLWLVKINSQLAGFVWSMEGKYTPFFYFPIANNDVVIFDTETFPNFRGQGINPLAINLVLQEMKKENIIRAYMSVKIWNESSVRAINKAQFKRMGTALKFHLFKNNIIIWNE